MEIFPLWIIRKFSVSVSSLRFPQKKGHPLQKSKDVASTAVPSGCVPLSCRAPNGRDSSTPSSTSPLTNVFPFPPPPPPPRPPGSAVGVVDSISSPIAITTFPTTSLRSSAANASHARSSGVRASTLGVAIPLAAIPNASAVDRASVPGSLTACAPQYTPCTVRFFTSARLSGSRGIRPEAKPTTRTRAPHRAHLIADANASPPTGSKTTSAPFETFETFETPPPLRFERRFEDSSASNASKTASLNGVPPYSPGSFATSTTASAPASAHATRLASPLAHATTSAPRALAICTAARPTPPAAPRTRTRSFGATLARSHRARCAVPWQTGNAAAAARESAGGAGKRTAPSAADGGPSASRTTTSSAMAPPPTRTPATFAPGANPAARASAPDSATTPENSPPGTKGSAGFSWYSPRAMRRSAKLSAANATFTRTPLGGTPSGKRRGRSSTANAPPSRGGRVGSPSSRHTSARIGGWGARDREGVAFGRQDTP